MTILGYFERQTRFLLGAAIVATVVSAAFVAGGGAPVITFGATAVALAMLASLVGEGTEQLGARQGPAVTGILQSALGNLPELFIGLFSLQAGLVVVVQFALIGSILANSLLVLGIAFMVGGLKHGTQRCHEPVRDEGGSHRRDGQHHQREPLGPQVAGALGLDDGLRGADGSGTFVAADREDEGAGEDDEEDDRDGDRQLGRMAGVGSARLRRERRNHERRDREQ